MPMIWPRNGTLDGMEGIFPGSFFTCGKPVTRRYRNVVAISGTKKNAMFDVVPIVKTASTALEDDVHIDIDRTYHEILGRKYGGENMCGPDENREGSYH